MKINDIMKLAAKVAAGTADKTADGGKYYAYKSGREAMVEAVAKLAGPNYSLKDEAGDDNTARKTIILTDGNSGLQLCLAYDVRLTQAAGGWSSKYALKDIKTVGHEYGDLTLAEAFEEVRKKDFLALTYKAGKLDEIKKELRETAEMILAALDSDTPIDLDSLGYRFEVRRTASNYNSSLAARRAIAK